MSVGVREKENSHGARVRIEKKSAETHPEGIVERRFSKVDTEQKKREGIINSSICPCDAWTRGVPSGQPRISKSLLNARLCRLTETARLLKNVKSVFTRRSNAASRVSVEVELSRKLSLPQTLAHSRRNSRVRGRSHPPRSVFRIDRPPRDSMTLAKLLSYWGKFFPTCSSSLLRTLLYQARA